ncbi:c-type cytochrome [Neobacillus niacini]|uniref:c-type cytochrome n=1 Tax=Neobacillus niacini TaxID=86668 RepID=UPI003B026D6D
MMKQLWIVLALLLLLLAGCSSNTADAKRPTDGEGLYKFGCLSCHGENLEGLAGPPITNMKAKYSEEEMLKLLNDGAGMMPGGLLTEEEAQTVTMWLLEK